MQTTSDEIPECPFPGALPAGTSLDEYVVVSTLSSDAHGVTYLARDGRLGRPVVIRENFPKVFCARDPDSLEVRSRQGGGGEAMGFAWSLESFEQEAVTLAALDHPGIVRVLRSFEAFGTVYLAMPFIEGTTLEAQIQRRREAGERFAEDELQGLLWRLLDTLEYLHARKLIHQGIRPSNILIDQDGQPVLTGFAAGRQRLEQFIRTSTAGTPGSGDLGAFRRPEQPRAWVDLYGLAATLHEAITGERPPDPSERGSPDAAARPLLGREDLAPVYSELFLASIDRAMASKVEGGFRSVADWRRWIWGGGTRDEQATIAALPPGSRLKALEIDNSPASPPFALVDSDEPGREGRVGSNELPAAPQASTIRAVRARGQASNRGGDKAVNSPKGGGNRLPKKGGSPEPALDPWQELAAAEKRKRRWRWGVVALVIVIPLSVGLLVHRAKRGRIGAVPVGQSASEASAPGSLAGGAEVALAVPAELQQLTFVGPVQQSYVLEYTDLGAEGRFRFKRLASNSLFGERLFNLRSGEISPDNLFRVESPTPEAGEAPAAVTIVFLPTNEPRTLSLGKTEIMTAIFAEFEFGDAARFRVKQGSEFVLPVDSPHVFTLGEVFQNGVHVLYESEPGKSARFEIPRTPGSGEGGRTAPPNPAQQVEPPAASVPSGAPTGTGAVGRGYGGNEGERGKSPIDGRPPELAWKTRIGIQGWRNNPIIVGENVYVGSCGQHWNKPDSADGLYGVSVTTGEIEWHLPTSIDFNDCAYLEGRLIGGDDFGNLYAASPTTGKVLWSTKLNGAIYARPVMVPDAEGIVVATGEGNLYLIDPGNGQVKDTTIVDGGVRAALVAIDNRKVFVGTESGKLYLFEIRRSGFSLGQESNLIAPDVHGSLKQVAENSGSDVYRKFNHLGNGAYERVSIYGAPAVITRGSEQELVIGFVRETYYKYPSIARLKGLAPIWYAEDADKLSMSFGNSRFSPACHLRTNLVLAASPYGNEIFAVDAESGRVKWVTEVGRSMFPHWSSPVVDGDYVLLARTDGYLNLLRCEDGERLWSIYLGLAESAGALYDRSTEPPGRGLRATWELSGSFPIYATPAVNRDFIIIGSGEGFLYGIRK